MSKANWLEETAHWIIKFSNGSLVITGSNPIKFVEYCFLEELLEELRPNYVSTYIAYERNKVLIDNKLNPLSIRILDLEDCLLQDFKL
jgi:hypothetical protein